MMQAVSCSGLTVYFDRNSGIRSSGTTVHFRKNKHQAIRLPKECRFSSDEVIVNKIGDVVILLPKENKWDSFMRAIDLFSDDFMADERTRDIVQEHEAI